MLEKIIDKDGSGKSVLIQASYLGIIKQLPFLISSLSKAMPKLHINITFTCAYNNPAEILNNDLVRHAGRPLKSFNNISIGYSHTLGFDLILVPTPTPIDSPNYCMAASNGIEFFLDPLKYEQRSLLSDSEISNLKSKYHIENEKVIVAGSIRHDEVASICTATKYAAKDHGKYTLIMVPRRSYAPIEDALEKAKMPYVKDTHEKKSNSDVVVVTEQGVLQDLYSICDVAFIGDTLWDTIRRGGQNPLEPAFYNKRIVCGDNWQNNEEAFVGLRKSGLLVQVASQDELNKAMYDALSSSPSDLEIKAAQDFIKSRQGASEMYARFIRDTLYSMN
jgi:hypothetical protein